MLTDGLPGGSVVKNLPANAGDEGLIHGLGRSPGGGNGKIFPPVFLLEKIPWTEEPESLQGCKKESDVTKWLNNTFLAELRWGGGPSCLPMLVHTLPSDLIQDPPS